MRPTTPACAGPRRAELAALLAALREAAGLTFAELAAGTAQLGGAAVSAATLSRAARCETVPKESTVLAYVRACGGGIDQEYTALRLWRAARTEERGVLARLQAPSVTNIRTPADLTAALAAAYEAAGAPPLRTLQQRAGTDNVKGDSLLPLGSAWRIIHLEGHPADWTQCAAFLRGCGINHRRMDRWHQAWMRAAANTEPAPSRAPYAPRIPLHGNGRALSDLSLVLHGVPVAMSFSPVRMERGLTRSAQVMARLLSRLSPQDRSTVLAASFVHLLDTEARRNGTASDTLIGHVRAGKNKAVPDSTPPSTAASDLLGPGRIDPDARCVLDSHVPRLPSGPAVGHPAVPLQPDKSPTRAASRRHRTPEPVPA